MTHTVGIVLKTFFLKKRKMIVLDRVLGKIECVPPHHDYSVGSVLSYRSELKGRIYFLSEVVLHDMPLVPARYDLEFIHHVLEIAYFCAPFAQPQHELYDCIEHLYALLPGHNDDSFKLAVLFKVVCLLGMLHDIGGHDHVWWYQLSREPIDSIAHKVLDLKIRQTLSEMVQLSLLHHPLNHHFKTVYITR